MNTADVVTKLDALDAALGDARDVASTLRAQEAFYSKKAQLTRTICGLRNDDLAKYTRLLAEWEGRRATVLNALEEIDRQIETLPDYHTIPDRRARDREWGRQQDVPASRKALIHGVEYFSGVPAVPNALKTILGVVVESDGRQIPNWPGGLIEIDARVAEFTRRRDAAQATVDAYLKAADELLSETVSG